MRFLHRYALEIGWPVPLLKKVMDSNDIAEAMAYERLEPFSGFRSDYRNAILCKLIADVNGAKRTKTSDFIPNWTGESQESELTRDIKEAFNIGNTS